MAAGTLGATALALRPRRTAAEVLGPSTPSGLWGAAWTDAGLVALWSSRGQVSVVRLTGVGLLAVERVLARPHLEVPAGIAAGGAPLVVGGAAEVRRARAGVPVGHLPATVRSTLEAEVDGPLTVGGAADELLGPLVVARTLEGAPVAVRSPVRHGVLGALLSGSGASWSAVQHPPSDEGDHCSVLTVSAGGRAVLEVGDLGLAGPVSLVGPVTAPLVSVADGEGRVRMWRLGAQPTELVSPGSADEVAVHVADGRPIGLRISSAGASVVGLGPGGWEVVRDVDDTEGARRVLAVGGAEAAFLVELPDRVVLVDGQGSVRR